MITSPKALVRGYPWADTITHEFVHLVLSRMTGERAPVWLQEGTAKLYERVWRPQGSGLLLDKAAEALLLDANAKGKLITFEQMHPSIAMLPSEDDAALAFAQVATFMRLYVERHGESALRDALGQIDRGADARDALSKAASLPFAKLESEWKAALPGARQREEGASPGDPLPQGRRRQRRCRRRGRRRRAPLPARGRPAVGSRARRGREPRSTRRRIEADDADPIAAARWARAALEAGNPNAAVQALTPQVELYPGHAPTHALLGSARLLLGERAAAREALREAILINPSIPTRTAISRAPPSSPQRPSANARPASSSSSGSQRRMKPTAREAFYTLRPRPCGTLSRASKRLPRPTSAW